MASQNDYTLRVKNDYMTRVKKDGPFPPKWTPNEVVDSDQVVGFSDTFSLEDALLDARMRSGAGPDDEFTLLVTGLAASFSGFTGRRRLWVRVQLTPRQITQ